MEGRTKSRCKWVSGRLKPKGERLKNGADPEGSFPHEDDEAVLERRETDHKL